jgi:hypothetical protein
MNDKRMKNALEAIARRGVPENTNLWPNISTRLERKSLMQTLRTRPIVAMLIAILILLALSGVVYALGKVFGYIPGVGLVDQSAPIRILAEPVTVEQAGMTITMSKVIADSTRTFISYAMAGMPVDEHGFPVCTSIPELRLPDGSKLDMLGDSGGIAMGRRDGTLSYETDYKYAPIPFGTDHVTFVFPCNFPGNDDSALEIPLDLVPAPPGFATPVIELAVTAESAQNKSGLSLERVLELADSYVLIGKFTDAGDLSAPLVISTSSVFDYMPSIKDANGTPVFFTVREDLTSEPIWDVAYYWAYEIPKPVAGPLTITVNSVSIRKDASAQFQFDTGAQPRVNQEWKFNQPIEVGAYTFTLDTITFTGKGYVISLSYEALPEGATIWISLLDNTAAPFQFDSGNETENHAGNKVRHTITLGTENPPPTGSLILVLQLDESLPIIGPWTLTWSPITTTP